MRDAMRFSSVRSDPITSLTSLRAARDASNRAQTFAAHRDRVMSFCRRAQRRFPFSNISHANERRSISPRVESSKERARTQSPIPFVRNGQTAESKRRRGCCLAPFISSLHSILSRARVRLEYSLINFEEFNPHMLRRFVVFAIVADWRRRDGAAGGGQRASENCFSFLPSPFDKVNVFLLPFGCVGRRALQPSAQLFTFRPYVITFATFCSSFRSLDL